MSWGTRSSTSTRCGISLKSKKVSSDVNTWLKIKQEASGWPDWVGDDETKRQQYIRDYYQNEGIQLDYDKIEHNPGLRALAKMMLNSMWGKFGQRLNKMQVEEFDDPQEFHSFLDSNARDVKHVSVVNDNIVEAHYQLQEEDIPVSPNLNVIVACFTACWTRLRLYEALELLGQRVLYFDTDSVIYLEEPGQPNPPLGDYLGQFTSELKADDHITEFVSGGPKNYGYQTKNGKVECKVRGFRLNSEGKTQLNYDVMRQNVLEEIQQPQKQPRQTQVVKTHQIVRDAKPTNSSPSQTTSVTSWCTTRESLMLSLSKPIPTDIKPDAKLLPSAFGQHTTRPVEAGRKRVASHLEKCHLRGCPPHCQKRVRLVVVQRQPRLAKTASSSETSRSTRYRASRSNLLAILHHL